MTVVLPTSSPRSLSIISFIKRLLKGKKSLHSHIDTRYIIPRAHHTISKADISPNALHVVNHLVKKGYQAYLVGGCVRDLLIGKAPKDFDVATNATPNQIKKLFKSARIIGKRFKLVHIVFYHDRETIEVATFRGQNDAMEHTNAQGMLIRDNVFGTLEEDAFRRDFTVNALYYAVENSAIVDFTEGFSDIQHRTIRMIGDPHKRYEEDPVRMLRAIRFSAKLQCTMEAKTSQAIHDQHMLIAHISNARLFDEMTKLYQCGHAFDAHQQLIQYGIFKTLFPLVHETMQVVSLPTASLLEKAAQSTDHRIHEGKTVNPAFIFAVLLWFPLKYRMHSIQESLSLDPLSALEKAMSEVLTLQWKTIALPKRYTQMIREIWLLQFRFAKRSGDRAHRLFTHPRFRAAYDFLLLRCDCGDENHTLGAWWTTFQAGSEEKREEMVAIETANSVKKRKRRKPKAKPEAPA